MYLGRCQEKARRRYENVLKEAEERIRLEHSELNVVTAPLPQ